MSRRKAPLWGIQQAATIHAPLHSQVARWVVGTVNRQVAHDARLSESVMMAHYVVERDEEIRQASNRTYQQNPGEPVPGGGHPLWVSS